VTSFPVLQKLP